MTSAVVPYSAPGTLSAIVPSSARETQPRRYHVITPDSIVDPDDAIVPFASPQPPVRLPQAMFLGFAQPAPGFYAYADTPCRSKHEPTAKTPAKVLRPAKRACGSAVAVAACDPDKSCSESESEGAFLARASETSASVRAVGGVAQAILCRGRSACWHSNCKRCQTIC